MKTSVPYFILVGIGFCVCIAQASRAGDEDCAEQAEFRGANAADERDICGIKVCWCPAGKFTMGSPATELERRLGEDQVEVTLTKGFWMAKYEATQGQWKRVV